MSPKLAAYAAVLATGLVSMSVAVVTRYQTATAGDEGAAAGATVTGAPLLAAAGEVTFALVSTSRLAPARASASASCLRARAAELAPSLALEAPGPGATTPSYVTEVRLEAGQAVPAPARERLRGLSRAEAAALAATRSAAVLHVRPEPPSLTALEDAMRLVAGCAEQCGSLVIDPSTGEVFTPRAFREQRVSTWEHGLPSLPDQMVVVSRPRPDGQVELRSVGLAKFGMPELTLAADAGLVPPLTRVIGLAAQALVEKGALDPTGRLTVDPSTLHHSRVRATPPTGECPSHEADPVDFSWRFGPDSPDVVAGTLGVAAAISGPGVRPRPPRLALTLLAPPAPRAAEPATIVACESSSPRAQAPAPAGN